MKNPFFLMKLAAAGFFLFLVFWCFKPVIFFPEFSALKQVSGKQFGTLEYVSHGGRGGGCSLRFILRSEQGDIHGRISSRRKCFELRAYDGYFLGAMEAWFDPDAAGGRSFQAYQLFAGGKVLRSYEQYALELKKEARRDLITLLASLAFALLMFAPMILMLVLDKGSEEADKAEDRTPEKADGGG